MAKLKDGFYKLTASSIGSDLLVLLAGGGAKPISDFAMADGTNATGTWNIDISGDADTLDGYHLSDILQMYSATETTSLNLNNLASGTSIKVAYWAYAGSPNVSNLPWNSSAATTWTLPGAYPLQIAKFYNSNDIRLRGYYNNSGWTSWKQLAFIDSNVASATQVMMNYSYDQDVNYPLVFTSRDNIGVAQNASLYIDFSGRPTYNPKSDTLTVGNINMTGSINGVLKATTSLGAALLNITEVTADTNYVHLYVSSLNSSATNTRALVLQNGYGNVGIGTPTPSAKLHVVGLVNITANSGTLTIGCLNTSWTHYSTTGGTHWFNKAVEVNGSLTPHANNSFTLGSSSKKWSTIYGVDGNFSGTIFVNTGDPTLKIYSGRITDAKSDGNICFLTCIDGLDGQSHAYAVDYQARCNISLLPRGGLVYIGTNPDGGNTSYKLYVNGKVYSTGYIKSGSSDSYVLLGGGGHKSISSFQTTYDGRYVLKAGDTMTGPLTISTSNWGNLLVLNRVNNGENWGPSIIFKFDGTHNGALSMQSNLLYIGDNGNVRYKAWHEGNDGSGSGLDADLLDGTHKTGLLTALSSSSSTNLSITVGGTTKSITNTYATNITLISCYNGTTNNDLWSTIKTSDYNYIGTATIYEVYNDGGPSTYGEVLDIVSVHANHWQPLLFFEAGKGGRLYYRNKDYNNNSWGNWRTIAYTSDIPTTMAWGNITGKPTEFNPASHTHSYLPLSGGWMDWNAGINFKGNGGSTAVYSRIGYATSASGQTMHCVNTAGNQANGALYIISNGSTSANDTGGLAIDNEGVTVFGAGDAGSNFTGVFRVLNEDNVADGPQFIVTKASGATVKYNMYAAHFYENSDKLLKTNIKPILDSDNIPILKSFDWKSDGSRGYGLIAQELEELGYPELVSTKDDGYKTVNYSAALSLIVGKLQVKIKELEKEIEILKNKN